MTKKVSPARDHIRLIEARIEQQIVENERLKSLGQDATAGERRLFLLHRALRNARPARFFVSDRPGFEES
jgi:hypothetical protein